MSFRIFLLSLGFVATAVCAQENAPTESAPAPTPESAPAAAPAAAPSESATQVPLDPAALQSVGVPATKEDRDSMAARAASLHAEAEKRQLDATQALATAQKACWKKFLVSSCLDDARVVYRKDITLSKRQEHEAKTLDRNVRKYDAAEHARLRDEENARRDAENEKKTESYHAKRAAEAQKKQQGN